MPHFPLSVRIIAVGKMRGSVFAAAAEDYFTRLRRYFEIEIIEVRTTLGKGKPEAQAMSDEGRELLKHARAEAVLIALQSEGREYGSIAFAQMLQKNFESGARQFDFILGGAAGLSEEVLARCRERLSLSHMTFAHELARVVLLEQLYRAGTILRGENYHK